jgi:hypothetical protein
MALAARLGQQGAHLSVAGLIEIAVELSDSMKRLRGLEAKNLIGLLTQFVAGAARGHRHSHQNAMSERTQGADRGFHCRSGGYAVVDQNYGAPMKRRGGTAVAVSHFPALDFEPFPRSHRVDGFLGNGISGDHAGLNFDDATAGDRTHGQFLLAGNAEFPHHKNIEGQMESARDLKSDRNAATRQGEHEGVVRAELLFDFVADHLGQRPAGLPPVLKDDDHVRPFFR